MRDERSGMCDRAGGLGKVGVVGVRRRRCVHDRRVALRLHDITTHRTAREGTFTRDVTVSWFCRTNASSAATSSILRRSNCASVSWRDCSMCCTAASCLIIRARSPSICAHHAVQQWLGRDLASHLPAGLVDALLHGQRGGLAGKHFPI